MGAQASKEGSKRSDGTRTPTGDGPDLNSWPSFQKSETKESSRSFRDSIKSKIPSTIAKSDSPRASTSGLTPTVSNTSRNLDGNESPLANDNTSKRDVSPAPSRSAQNLDVPGARSSVDAAALPPPSPTQSASLGQGHESVDQAQKSGEVGNISDAPPSGAKHPSALDQPGPPILIKPDYSGPRAIEKFLSLKEGATSPSPELSSLKDVDLDDMITRLLDAGYTGKVTKSVCLKNAEITVVCAAVREVLLSQPALIELNPPVKIVGDIHGQYTDLLRLFEMCGYPPAANYLFLGDYVDRGKQSLETILLLMCYKLKYPENFFLLRGNHESANVTRVYGFYDECKRRTNIKIWKTFIDAFNCLPIASIVAGKIFCVHGGLSPQLKHMDDIRRIQRPTDVPDYGLLNDLLWSDPADIQGDWESNERGVSYCFGKNVIMQFLQAHDFDLVCRAHMVVEDGYEFFNERILVTVFSAPNYCGEFDNWGAVMSVSGELLCSFELLKPLDSSALKTHIKKARNSRLSMLNSPPANQYAQSV